MHCNALLEFSCCKKWQKSPNQETGLENKGPPETLNYTKLIPNEGVTYANLGPIGYHLEPSYVPYSPNQFLGWDFFCRFLQQYGSSPKDYHLLSCLSDKGTLTR